jgi:hypothetical protein
MISRFLSLSLPSLFVSPGMCMLNSNSKRTHTLSFFLIQILKIEFENRFI